MKEKIKHISFGIIVGMVIFISVNSFVSVKKAEETQLKVGFHIKGAVNAPGYYELDYGSRVKDAIRYAGGEKENADITSLNLAQKIYDGQEIIIALKENPQEEKEPEKININKADVYSLCKLEGIGEVTAAKIVSYRAEHGQFKTLEEIQKISGIGKAEFNNIKDKITLG